MLTGRSVRTTICVDDAMGRGSCGAQEAVGVRVIRWETLGENKV